MVEPHDLWIVCAGRGDDEHWVVLPSLMTARTSAAYWEDEGYYVWVRKCSDPIDWRRNDLES